jgi:hypothetical protein
MGLYTAAVPVIIAHPDVWQSLPFRRLLDWHSFAVFVEAAAFQSDPLGSLVDAVQAAPYERLRRALRNADSLDQRAGPRQVFRDVLAAPFLCREEGGPDGVPLVGQPGKWVPHHKKCQTRGCIPKCRHWPHGLPFFFFKQMYSCDPQSKWGSAPGPCCGQSPSSASSTRTAGSTTPSPTNCFSPSDGPIGSRYARSPHCLLHR